MGRPRRRLRNSSRFAYPRQSVAFWLKRVRPASPPSAELPRRPRQKGGMCSKGGGKGGLLGVASAERCRGSTEGRRGVGKGGVGKGGVGGKERDRQRKADKKHKQPFVADITLIEQTIKFCKSLTSGKEEKQEEEKKAHHLILRSSVIVLPLIPPSRSAVLPYDGCRIAV